MAGRIIMEGDKIEFREILNKFKEQDGIQVNKYVSQVFEYDEDEDYLKVAMPISKGQLIPLSKGSHYDAFFYTSKGMYYSKVVILDRYKSNNIYGMKISLETEPVKYQRRKYYRLDKSIPLYYIELKEHIFKEMLETKKFPEELKNINDYGKGNTIDISGGGMRFLGDHFIESGKKMLILFDIMVDDKNFKFRLPATIIRSMSSEGRTTRFEHRVEFLNISKEYRELLIKYIFEEERKMRQRSH